MARKINSMRLLDASKIPYEVYTFSTDIHSASGVAAAIGQPLDHVYKTLVVMRLNGKSLLAIVPGHRKASLKHLAQAIGEKRLHMATQMEAESLTGLQVGGISALALVNRGFDVFLDRSALDLDRIVVSAGRRGINLRLRVEDLVRATGATFVEATSSEEG
ncbi:MAG: aminoacyl-tRNA deacylase [Chloroflexota bacterium]|nr:aminoacyl-tRNA deacylase [Anaerolineae bacterium]